METARGPDIYQEREVTRQIYSLYATVRPGNSGGPLLSRAGRVLGVVFASSTDDAHTGYALTAAEVAPDGVAQSTVYRTLEHLERAGLVEQVSLTPDRRTYHRTSTAAHLHLRCMRCGDLQQADVGVLRRLSETLEATAGFRLDTAHPVLTGLCASCRSAEL